MPSIGATVVFLILCGVDNMKSKTSRPSNCGGITVSTNVSEVIEMIYSFIDKVNFSVLYTFNNIVMAAMLQLSHYKVN